MHIVTEEGLLVLTKMFGTQYILSSSPFYAYDDYDYDYDYYFAVDKEALPTCIINTLKIIVLLCSHALTCCNEILNI